MNILFIQMFTSEALLIFHILQFWKVLKLVYNKDPHLKRLPAVSSVALVVHHWLGIQMSGWQPTLVHIWECRAYMSTILIPLVNRHYHNSVKTQVSMYDWSCIRLSFIWWHFAVCREMQSPQWNTIYILKYRRKLENCIDRATAYKYRAAQCIRHSSLLSLSVFGHSILSYAFSRLSACVDLP